MTLSVTAKNQGREFVAQVNAMSGGRQTCEGNSVGEVISRSKSAQPRCLVVSTLIVTRPDLDASLPLRRSSPLPPRSSPFVPAPCVLPPRGTACSFSDRSRRSQNGISSVTDSTDRVLFRQAFYNPRCSPSIWSRRFWGPDVCVRGPGMSASRAAQ